jgi:hypothetical protein
MKTLEQSTLEFLLEVGQESSGTLHYIDTYNGGNRISYENGKYIFENNSLEALEDIKKIKKFLEALGVKCSSISTGQSRHNCGRKYLKIDGIDPVLRNFIVNGTSVKDLK